MLDLSPSLLLGLLIAGLVHLYLPEGLVHRGLNRPNLRSAARAALIGVPLPLCSCGVIPTALGLRNQGASKGATTAFMISTPLTGVDSLLVSASFLGWPFALFKLAAAFVTGLIGGTLVNRFTTPGDQSRHESVVTAAEPSAGGLKGALRYAVFDLLAAIDLWVLTGVLAAALIATFIPTDYLAGLTWTQGIGGMLLVLAISIPLYVCTTGSVPIAASLIAAGMPTGTALVFLMAGPATNVATLGAVYRVLGTRVLAIYLGTVILMSVLLGLGFDALLSGVYSVGWAVPTGGHSEHGGHSPPYLAIGSALLLSGLLAYLLGLRLKAMLRTWRDPEPGTDLMLKVEGMSCGHCVGSVKKSLEGVAAVSEATPDLASGLVRVRGDHLDVTALIRAVEAAGFRASGP
nr:permease [Candidatus Thiosymbion oneisti]